MIRFTLENQEYQIQDDVVVKDNSHEELYSYIVTIPNSDKLDIETMDYATLEDDNGLRASMVINAINEETTSFNPIKYRYTLSALSEAVKLQKIICPNLKITKRKIKTPLTIYEKIEQYFNVYVKPQYPELSLSSDLQGLLGDAVCPEKMWNRPTMFEVFNDLLMTKNAQVDIRFHEITYKPVKMDDIGNEIDTSKLSLENHTQNINEYANRLDIELNNGIGDKSIRSVQGISQRSYSSAVLSEDNAEFTLDRPIDYIHNAVLFIPNTHTDYPAYYEIDITKYIVESTIYQTYLTTGMEDDALAESNDINYKRLALYYTQGSNNISGLSFDEKKLIGTSKTAIRTIAYRELYRTYGKDTAKVAIEWQLADLKGNDSRKWLLSVNYRPIDTFRFNVAKVSKHNATMVDNQSDSYVDVKDFINSEQEKLNRLGNKTLIISGRYKNYNDIPQLSDYIDDYILAEREIVIHDHFVLFKGYLYKDYIRRNAYYGINSRKRNSVIATGNDALTRNDIIERKYSFSTKQSNNKDNEIPRYLLTGINSYGLTNGYIQPSMNNALIKTYDENGADLIGDYYIFKKTTTYAENRINLAYFSMDDNFGAGVMVAKKGYIGGYGQEYAKYVDKDGEFKKIEIQIRTNEASYIVGDVAMENYNYEISGKLPLISYDNVSGLFPPKYYLGTFEKVLYKDNAEITAITIQFTFFDSEEVIIGTFGNYTPISLLSKHINDLVIYYSNTESYEVGDMLCKGNVSEAIINTAPQANWNNGDTTSVLNYINIYNTTGMRNCRSWAIGRANGELILGVNCNKGFKDTIYMNEIE